MNYIGLRILQWLSLSLYFPVSLSIAGVMKSAANKYISSHVHPHTLSQHRSLVGRILMNLVAYYSDYFFLLSWLSGIMITRQFVICTITFRDRFTALCLHLHCPPCVSPPSIPQVLSVIIFASFPPSHNYCYRIILVLNSW